MKLHFPQLRERKCGFSRPLAVVACLCSLPLLLLEHSANANPPAPLAARITPAGGETVNVRAQDRFRPVALSRGQSALVELQLPSSQANLPAVAQALDGGIIAPALAVAVNGKATLGFQPGVQPGRYRLLIKARGRTALLQFEVANQ